MIFAVVFLFGEGDLAPPFQTVLPVQAQTNKRNVFETRRSTTPNRSRSRTDDETNETLRQALGKGFGKHLSSGSLLLYLGFFAVLFALIFSLVYYDSNYRRYHSSLENPWIVFRELCKAHQLTRAEARFLKKISEDFKLDDPLPLFIEPRYFIGALENKTLESSKPMIQYLMKKFFEIEPGQEAAFQTQIVNERPIIGLDTVLMDETVVQKPRGMHSAVNKKTS